MDDIFLYVEVMGFKKFKGRTDVAHPSWFRCSNEILEDDDFHDFTAAEMCAIVYIFSQSNKQTSAVARINLEKVDGLSRKFNRDDLQSAIKKATLRGILRLHVTPPLRPRNADVTPPGRIGEDRRTDETEEESESAANLPPANASQNKTMGIVLPELAGNSKREQALSTIPTDLQQEWIDTYDLQWLKNAMLKAISNYAKKDPVDTLSDWEGKLIHWFAIEKKPKYKLSAMVPKPREPVVSQLHSLTPINEIIGMNVMDALAIAKKQKLQESVS